MSVGVDEGVGVSVTVGDGVGVLVRSTGTPWLMTVRMRVVALYVYESQSACRSHSLPSAL